MLKMPKSKLSKVLVIARFFPPFSPVGHSIRVVKFVKYLPALGWQPTVLTIDDQKEYETTHKVGSETLLSEIRPQVNIFRTAAGEPSLKLLEKERKFSQRNRLTRMIAKLWVGTRRWVFQNIFLPDRYIAWMPFAVRQGCKIVKSEGVDVIFATCPPYSVLLVGATLKRLTGKPLVLDFRDDWIGTPWYHSRPTMIRLIERRMENWAVKTADKVILVTELSRNAFLSRYPEQHSDKFELISNGCDLAEFAVLNSTPSEPCNSKFTIVHAGSLNDSKNWTRTPAALFQAVQHILQQQPELAEKMTIVFAGDFPEGQRRLAEEMGLEGVIKELGHLSHDAVLRLLKSADMLLSIATEHFSSVIPGKIYEYWAIGGPPILLISYPGAATVLVKRYGLGFTVEPSDLTGIEQAILTVYQRHQSGEPVRISATGIEAFDRMSLTKKLARILSEVCNRQRLLC